MLVDYFDRVYTEIEGKSKFSSLKRFITRITSNILIPCGFILTRRKEKKSLPGNNNKKKIVVSLTSFPARINRIWLVIECMLRQSILPDAIVLYLAESQFPKKEKDLPKRLLRYISKNQLTVEFVEDLRSHKKYFYSFQQFSDDLVVLIDDDIFYPTYIIENLLKEHKKSPNSIICTRGYIVQKEKGEISSYSKWKLLKNRVDESMKVFHTSGGGTLYNPRFFSQDLFNKEVFIKYCKYADDVWLNIHAQRSKINTVKVSGFSEVLPILNLSSFALKNINVAEGGNDRQLKKLIHFYELDQRRIF